MKTYIKDSFFLNIVGKSKRMGITTFHPKLVFQQLFLYWKFGIFWRFVYYKCTKDTCPYQINMYLYYNVVIDILIQVT